MIAKWLDQAQKLAAKNTSASEPALGGEVEARRRVNSIVNEDGWKPFASFVVEFQSRTLEGRAEELRTAIHHIETDTGAKWPGITSEQPVRWMLGQVTEKVRQVSEASKTTAQPVERLAARIEITQVRAFQPPQADTPVGFASNSQTFEGQVKGGEPFALEIGFRLIGPTASHVASMQPTRTVRSYAYDRSTGKSQHLGDAQPDCLDDSSLAYTARLPKASLPAGSYRLWVLAAIQPAVAVPDYLEVPLVQVI